MYLRLALAAFAPLLLAAAQPADDTSDTSPAWRGQMQCGVTWTDPADDQQEWTLSVGSDTTNMNLGIIAPARKGDPSPLATGETRDLVPRKARLEISGLGGGEIDVSSYATGEGRMWHNIGLGHVEKLDDLPSRFTMTLTIGSAPPLAMEMRDFTTARAYLKRCLER